MTIRTLLEGYGINVDTLKFDTIKGMECESVEEIMKSINEAEISVEVDDFEEMGTTEYSVEDYDILEDGIILYCEIF